MNQRGWTNAGVSGVVMLGLLVSGCAQTPLGPTVQVMPGPGKSFESVHLRSGGLQAVRRGRGRRTGTERQQRAAVGAAAISTVLGRGLWARPSAAAAAPAIGAASGALGGAGHRRWQRARTNNTASSSNTITRLRSACMRRANGAWLWPDDGQRAAASATPASMAA